MAIFLMGGEPDTFSLPPGIGTYSISTDTTKYDANVSRCAMVLSGGISELNADFQQTGGVSDVYLRFRWAQDNVVAGTLFDIYDEGFNQVQYRFESTATGQWSVSRYDGAAFQLLGTTTNAMFVNDIGNVHIHIVRDAAAGVVEIKKDGAVELSLTNIDTSTPATMGGVRFIGLSGAGNNSYLSQFVASDIEYPTGFVYTAVPNADGDATSWVGDYTAIDDIFNDANFIETNTINQEELNQLTDLPAQFSTYAIKAVSVNSRVSIDAGAVPADIQHIIRTGNTTYSSTNLGVVKDGSVQIKQTVWETNPQTSAPWTYTEVNALQSGAKSV